MAQESMWHEKGLLVDVYGEPAPKGSMKLVTRGRRGMPLARPLMVADNAHEQERWASNIRGAMLAALAGKSRPVFGRQVPLVVHLHFSLERPPSVKRSHPSVEPDLDKLVRATLDPLHGSVFANDAAIVRTIASKTYKGIGVGELGFVGARIEIWPLDGAKERR